MGASSHRVTRRWVFPLHSAKPVLPPYLKISLSWKLLPLEKFSKILFFSFFNPESNFKHKYFNINLKYNSIDNFCWRVRVSSSKRWLFVDVTLNRVSRALAEGCRWSMFALVSRGANFKSNQFPYKCKTLSKGTSVTSTDIHDQRCHEAKGQRDRKSERKMEMDRLGWKPPTWKEEAPDNNFSTDRTEEEIMREKRDGRKTQWCVFLFDDVFLETDSVNRQRIVSPRFWLVPLYVFSPIGIRWNFIRLLETFKAFNLFVVLLLIQFLIAIRMKIATSTAQNSLKIGATRNIFWKI